MIAALAREFGAPIERLPLWSPKFTPETLAQIRAEDARSYERGFRQIAHADSEKMFPSFMRAIRYGVDWHELAWKTWRFATGTDLSTTKRPGCWIVTLALTPEGQTVLVDARQGAWTSPQTLRNLAEVDELFGPDVHVVESVAFQQNVLEWAEERRADYPWSTKIEGYQTTGTTKADREVGMPALEIEFEHGSWLVPYATRHRVDCDCTICVLVRQVDAYPHGTRDDAVMALWFAREGLRKLGRKNLAGTRPMPSGEELEALMAAVRESRAAALEEAMRGRA